MANIQLREKAQKLRKKGYGIGEIARKLNASKSTVSWWCHDIKLSRAQQAILAKRQTYIAGQALLRAAEHTRAARIQRDALHDILGAKDIGVLTKRDVLMLGVALYWAEGYRTGNREFGFTNSSAGIIRAFLNWITNAYAIPRSDLILRVTLNSLHTKREASILQYWSRLVGVPLQQFSKTSFIKSIAKKEFSNNREYFGTLRIKVRRGTALRQRVLGSLKEVERQLPS